MAKSPQVANASLADVLRALASGRTTASALTRAYLSRIKAFDRAGPKLNAVREINPDALSIARSLDEVKPSTKRPLAGVPVLLKDNIATGWKRPRGRRVSAQYSWPLPNGEAHRSR